MIATSAIDRSIEQEIRKLTLRYIKTNQKFETLTRFKWNMFVKKILSVPCRIKRYNRVQRIRVGILYHRKSSKTV